MKKKSLSAKKKIHNKLLIHLKNPKISKIYKEFKNSLNISNNFAVAISGGSDSLSLAFLEKCYSLIQQIESEKDSTLKPFFSIDLDNLSLNGKSSSTIIKFLFIFCN